jgi:hypothetical protein
MRPLGKTAGDIRMAWTLSRTAEELQEALAAKGITLAAVSAEEARHSERVAAFAKETGGFARVLREGEIVAVNGRGDVHRLDQRTTGNLRPEIEARLDGFAGMDRAGLLNVTDAKEVMQEASGASFADERRAERDMARPLTGIEATIAEALANTMTGTEFAAALDKAGVTITRATEADQLALDALRQDAALGAAVARAEGVTHSARHFDTVQAGDFAAVTRAGDVFRLNPTALDFEEAEQRLADVQPRLPSVEEALHVNEIGRAQNAELWAQRRAENLEAHALRSENRDAERDIRRTDAQMNRAVYDAADRIEQSVEQASSIGERFLRGLGKRLASLVEAVAEFLAPPPPLTKGQAELKERADEERAEARAQWNVIEERATSDLDRLIAEMQQQQQQRDAAAPPRTRERDDDRGYERER